MDVTQATPAQPSAGEPFDCPGCGAPLQYDGHSSTIKCSYCGQEVVVPERLRPATIPTFTYQAVSGEQIAAALQSVESAVSSAQVQRVATRGCLSGVIGFVVLMVAIFGGVAALLWYIFSSIKMPTIEIPSVPAVLAAKASPTIEGGDGVSHPLFQHADLMTVDSKGDVFVADSRNVQVQKYGPDGNYITGWKLKGAVVHSIVADGAGNFYATNNLAELVKYDGQNGTILGVFKHQPDTSNPKRFTIGFDGYGEMAALPGGGLLASFFEEDDWTYLDSNGHESRPIDSPVGSQTGHPVPGGKLAVGPNGDIFFVDSDNANIYRFTADGKLLNGFGGEGSAPGQFDTWPSSITVDRQGHVFVSAGKEIFIFTSTGTYIDRITRADGATIDALGTDDKGELVALASDKITRYTLTFDDSQTTGK